MATEDLRRQEKNERMSQSVRFEISTSHTEAKERIARHVAAAEMARRAAQLTQGRRMHDARPAGRLEAEAAQHVAGALARAVRVEVDEERDDVPPALGHRVAAVEQLPRERDDDASVGVEHHPSGAPAVDGRELLEARAAALVLAL